MTQSIARQAVRGSIYSLIASGITLVLGLTRSILLARLLLPEYFGVVALALVFLNLAGQLRSIGLDIALIHRQEVDQNFLRTYFSLHVGLDLAGAGLLLAAMPLLQRMYPQTPHFKGVLGLLVVAFILSNFSAVQETLLRKKLDFKSLAMTDVAASLTMTLAAPLLAWRGFGLWALVAEQLSSAFARLVLTWGPFRQWRAGFGWDRSALKWLWGYGKSTWSASNLSFYLDRFDDFWVGTALGSVMLGYYSKAYEFAQYPTRLIAAQLIGVFTPVFARLQQNREALSRSFYRSSHVILRTGSLAAGLLVLVLPEFIHYVIGDKWLPMMWTFRLMAAYAVFNPLVILTKRFFLATGHPAEALRTSAAQALFFTPAVILGAYLWAINGVALAADGMLLVGFLKAYRPLRDLIDFSPFRLIGHPVIALTLALGVGLAIEQGLQGQAWLVLAAKSISFLAVFTGLMFFMEGKDYLRGIQTLWLLVRPDMERGL